MKWMSVFLLLLGVVVEHSSYAADDFSWLKAEPHNEASVRAYLEQQNRSAQLTLNPLKPLQQSLIAQWQNAASAKAESPWLIRGDDELNQIWLNGERVIARRKRNSQSQSILLNIEQRAAKHDYYRLANWSLSPDGKHLALAEDVVGDENYRIVVINLAQSTALQVAIKSETALLWGRDSRRLYTIEHLSTEPAGVALYEHFLDTGRSQLKLMESDPQWILSAYVASDPEYAVIQLNNEVMSEQRLLNLVTGALLEPIRPRQNGIEYYANVVHGKLYINSNHTGNFGLYQSALGASQWQVVYIPKSSAELKHFYLFAAGILIHEHEQGRDQLVIIGYDKAEPLHLAMAPEGAVGWISRVGDFNSNIVHIRSMSMIQPAKWERLHIGNAQRSLISEDAYPGFQQSAYRTEQISIQSGSVRVPVTLAYKSSMLHRQSPVLLYGYGAYGFTMRPYFMSQIISLLDKGFIYAIAHVRGGGYYGEAWHSAGKGVNKPAGIADFVAAAKTLQSFKQGQRKIAAMGSSAGGTLIAAAVNQHPEYFSAVSLNVPFVDVVASMSDASQPLTAQQYHEWGNPRQANELAVMADYDPVNNVGALDYPATMVRVGWHDSRVPYWEGAKYLSLLAARSQGRGPYLLLTDFQSGHAMDRRQALAQQAMDYAFLIHYLLPSEQTEL